MQESHGERQRADWAGERTLHAAGTGLAPRPARAPPRRETVPTPAPWWPGGLSAAAAPVPSRAVLGCTGMYWDVLGHGGVGWDTVLRLGPSRTRLYWAVLGHRGLYCTVLCCTPLSWTVLGSVGPHSTIWGHIGL